MKSTASLLWDLQLQISDLVFQYTNIKTYIAISYRKAQHYSTKIISIFKITQSIKK
jgi:hypothetical protein